jgi:predicted ferric reductase
LISAITITSISGLRRRHFEVFYYLHIAFSASIVICTYFHSGLMIPSIAAVTWGADWFVRSIVMARFRYPRKASLKIISASVVELSFPKGDLFAYNPGQYVYLAIPEISWYQWHPFSVVSSPHQPVVKLYIRKVGNWTGALFDLAKTNPQVSMLLEGPYGNLSVDIVATDRKYRNILLISGGIGSKWLHFFR